MTTDRTVDFGRRVADWGGRKVRASNPALHSTPMSPATHAAICRESRDLVLAINSATLGDLDDRDGRALLTMLRNVRLFLTPEQCNATPTPPLANPSFG